MPDANVISTGVTKEKRHRQLISSMLKAGDYTTPRFPFHYHFEVNGKVHIYSSVELAGLL
ncbi:hypothetical protein [Yersinia proxima]|uniref:hypothetical protein n=1 Tax=Yersinia proxima TaxID=2890316 RepID=UPI001D10FB99|nr:hypothetical protein [Yersinia proxima]